ncbi:MAG: hypothetical protein AB1598_05865 [Thermodesulfobacteriota bacterium]
MKSGGLRLVIFVTAFIALIYACGGSSSSDSPNPQPTPEPTPQPTSSPSACNSPSLNTPYLDGDDVEEFYVYNAPGSTLDTHLFSDGSNVYVLVFDGTTTFGFSGVPTGAGTACEFIKADADYNNDGTFDETANSFFSSCIRLDNGGGFTFLDGPSRVDASPEFEQRLLILYNQVLYFNVFATLSCDLTEPVPDSGIYEPLLLQLQAGINAL